MSMKDPSLTIGIEEEYLLVDKETRDLASDPPKQLLADCEEALAGQVSPEFLRCQIEVGTPVCKSVAEARKQLGHLRLTIAEKAEKYGLAPIAASTHPFAHWERQHHTDKQRYNELAQDMQVVVRRLLICGMHVHVGIEDEALRIDLFNQLTYFLPHLLALSTSSPFWQGRRSGLKSYRLAVFNELPRSGLPQAFDSADEYRRTVEMLVEAGMIEDATKIWWDLRPSARFPTLEMRVTDVATRMEDTLTIAALYQCITRMLWRLRRKNQRWRTYSPFLVSENRWQAQRHGAAARMVDFGRGECLPFHTLIDELIDLVAEDADHLGCTAEVQRARAIASEGTSANRQLEIYDKAIDAGETHDAAMRNVVDFLIGETVAGIER